MSEVKINLSAKDEIALLNRYGRRCSSETLVKRAVAEVIKQQAEDVPVFEGRAAYEARLKAEEEAKRLGTEASRPSTAVDAILFRFKSGEKFMDGEGREISALQYNPGPEEQPPLMAQFGGDDAGWYPIGPDELKPAVVCICGQDGKLISPDCPVPAHAADAAAATPDIPESPHA